MKIHICDMNAPHGGEFLATVYGLDNLELAFDVADILVWIRGRSMELHFVEEFRTVAVEEVKSGRPHRWVQARPVHTTTARANAVRKRLETGGT